ncbi:TLDc domain-containing protein [Entamoeba marina]
MLNSSIGAFKEQEIVQLGNLVKIVENGANNEFVSSALFRMLSSCILKLNDAAIEQEKKRSLQIEEIVAAVNFLKERVDEVRSIAQNIPTGQSQPIINIEDIENIKDENIDANQTSRVNENDSNALDLASVTTLDEFGITKQEIQQLKDWTGINDCEVIYDSSVHGLSSYSLNDKICGKQNIMVMFKTTDSNVFGTFNAAAIPTPQQESDYCFLRNDKKNSHKTTPLLLRKKSDCSSDASIMIHCSNEDIFYVSKGFSVRTVGSFVHPGFAEEYDDPSGIGADLLTGTHDPTKFSISGVVALQWNNKDMN